MKFCNDSFTCKTLTYCYNSNWLCWGSIYELDCNLFYGWSVPNFSLVESHKKYSRSLFYFLLSIWMAATDVQALAKTTVVYELHTRHLLTNELVEYRIGIWNYIMYLMLWGISCSVSKYWGLMGISSWNPPTRGWPLVTVAVRNGVVVRALSEIRGWNFCGRTLHSIWRYVHVSKADIELKSLNASQWYCVIYWWSLMVALVSYIVSRCTGRLRSGLIVEGFLFWELDVLVVSYLNLYSFL